MNISNTLHSNNKSLADLFNSTHDFKDDKLENTKEFELFNQLQESSSTFLAYVILYLIVGITDCSIKAYLMAKNQKFAKGITLVIGLLEVLLIVILLILLYIKGPTRKNVRRVYAGSLIPWRGYLQNIFFIGSTVYFGLNLIMRASFGSCENDLAPYTYYCDPGKREDTLPITAMITLMFFPMAFSFVVRDIHFELVILSWLITSAFIAACTIVSISAKVVLPPLVIYMFGSFFVYYESQRRNVAMFWILHKMQFILAENERLADETHATEMRHMIANVAHDLKTPLTSFLSGIDYISHVLEDFVERRSSGGVLTVDFIVDQVAAMTGCLDSIRNTNSFMIMTINRCIDYTKASKGMKLVPKLETIDLQEALNLPLRVMSDLQERVTMKLEVISEDICTHVITDKQWLQENLLCLMSNAVKYSSKGSVDINVSLITEEQLLSTISAAAVKIKGKKKKKRKLHELTHQQKAQQQQHLQQQRLTQSPSSRASMNITHDNTHTSTYNSSSYSRQNSLFHYAGSNNNNTNNAGGRIGSSNNLLTYNSLGGENEVVSRQLSLKRRLTREISMFVFNHDYSSSGNSNASQSDYASSAGGSSKYNINNNYNSNSGKYTRRSFARIGRASRVFSVNNFDLDIPAPIHSRASSSILANNCNSTNMLDNVDHKSSSSEWEEGEEKEGRGIAAAGGGVVDSVEEDDDEGVEEEEEEEEEEGDGNTHLVEQKCPDNIVVAAVQVSSSSSSVTLAADKILRTSNLLLKEEETGNITKPPPIKTMSVASANLPTTNIAAILPTNDTPAATPTAAAAATTASLSASPTAAGSNLLLKFEIQDTGIGLSEEAMKNLFNPFKQAQRLAGGTGLGLFSLAKRIEALGGQYGVSKRKDGKQGSVFWFVFKYRPDFASSMMQQQRRRRESPSAGSMGIAAVSAVSNAVHAAVIGSNRRASGGRSVAAAVDAFTNSSSRISFLARSSINSTTANSDCHTAAVTSIAIPTTNCTTSSKIESSDEGDGGDYNNNNNNGNNSSTATNSVRPFVSLTSVRQQQTSMRSLMRQSSLRNGKLLHILIVDDAISILKMTTMMLRRQGHTVEQAENGAEALEIIMDRYLDKINANNNSSLVTENSNSSPSTSSASNISSNICAPFDVVLMDLQMPVMDGLEAARRLRAREIELRSSLLVAVTSAATTNAGVVLAEATTSGLSPASFASEAMQTVGTQLLNLRRSLSNSLSNPVSPRADGTTAKLMHQLVIGVSANSDYETMQEALTAGVDAFMSKPFSLETFYDVLHRVKADNNSNLDGSGITSSNQSNKIGKGINALVDIE